MTDEAWLASLKAGDKVLVTTVNWGHEYESGIVKKVGKLHLTVGTGHESRYERNFRVRDGREVGGGYRVFIQRFDQSLWDAQEEESARQTLAYKLDETKWRDLDHGTLKAIYALLPVKEKPE